MRTLLIVLMFASPAMAARHIMTLDQMTAYANNRARGYRLDEETALNNHESVHVRFLKSSAMGSR